MSNKDLGDNEYPYQYDGYDYKEEELDEKAIETLDKMIMESYEGMDGSTGYDLSDDADKVGLLGEEDRLIKATDNPPLTDETIEELEKEVLIDPEDKVPLTYYIPYVASAAAFFVIVLLIGYIFINAKLKEESYLYGESEDAGRYDSVIKNGRIKDEENTEDVSDDGKELPFSIGIKESPAKEENEQKEEPKTPEEDKENDVTINDVKESIENKVENVNKKREDATKKVSEITEEVKESVIDPPLEESVESFNYPEKNEKIKINEADLKDGVSVKGLYALNAVNFFTKNTYRVYLSDNNYLNIKGGEASPGDFDLEGDYIIKKEGEVISFIRK